MPEQQKHKELNIRSEQVQEILEATPIWMIRWGNTLILTLVFGLLFLSWLIKYPDTLSTEILISTSNPVETIYAKNNLSVDSIFVKSNTSIFRGSILCVINSPKNYEDLLRLKMLIDNVNLLDESIEIDFKLITLLNLSNISNNLLLLKKDYQTYKREPQNRLALKNFIKSFNKLKEDLQDWESKHLIISAKNGTVFIPESIQNNAKIYKDDLMFSITPKNQGEYNGSMKLAAQKIALIKVGQKVNIEYSSNKITGIVNSISQFPDINGHHNIGVALPDAFKSILKNKNGNISNLKGTATIITNNLRLIDRLFHRLRNIIN